MDESNFNNALKRLNAGAMSKEEFRRTFGASPEHANIPIIGQRMTPQDCFMMLLGTIKSLTEQLRGDFGRPWPVHAGPIVPERGRGFISPAVDPRWMGLEAWS